MSCSSRDAVCCALSRTARIAPAIFGCIVFTRPSSISGKPVTALTSRTGMPDSRKRRAVPPVEIRSAPRAARPRANSDTPALSVTLIRIRIRAGLLDRPALAAAEFQREVVGIAPVLISIGFELRRLRQVSQIRAEELDLEAQHVVPERLALALIFFVVREHPLHRN